MLSKTEVANGLKDLDPLDAHDVITSYLTEHDMPHKIWQAEDIASVLTGGEEATPEDQKIIDAAMGTRPWRDLSDCTDTDWMLVDLAIDEARGQQ